MPAWDVLWARRGSDVIGFELNSVMVQAEMLKRQAEEAARAKAQENRTNSPATNAASKK